MQARGTNPRLTSRGLAEHRELRSEGGSEANEEGTEEQHEQETRAKNTCINIRRKPDGGRGRRRHLPGRDISNLCFSQTHANQRSRPGGRGRF